MNKQEAQARLKELEKEKAELEKVIKAKDDEFPRRGDDYCYLTDEGIRTSTNTNHYIVSERFKRGVFHTKKEAQLADQARIAITTIKNYARKEWGEFKPDWGDDIQPKYCILFTVNQPITDFWYERNTLNPIGYFKKQKHAEEIIEKFPQELETIRKFYS